MVELCSVQKHYSENLISVGFTRQFPFKSILVSGPAGSGKTTICKGTAKKIGMKFIEIPVNDSAINVERRLFGSIRKENHITEKFIQPGELETEKDTLVLLSGIQNIDLNITQKIQKLLTTRKYIDPLGRDRILSDGIWIIGNYTNNVSEKTISLDHWLCKIFTNSVYVNAPYSPEDLNYVFNNIVEDIGLPIEFDINSGINWLILPNPSDNLHSIKRWIDLIVSSPKREKHINTSTLLNALKQDTVRTAERLVFRGVSLPTERILKWQSQFPKNLQPIALHLINQINSRYFITIEEFYRIIDRLIRRSGIKRGQKVTFCKWQALGKSSPRCMHVMKNLAKWKSKIDIDLTKSEEFWPDLPKDKELSFILTDDFVGSGGSLMALCKSKDEGIFRLLEKYPKSKIFVLIISGYKDGIEKAKNALSSYYSRIRIIPGRLFDNRDKCFHQTSRILPIQSQRDNLKNFCLCASKEYYPNLPDLFRYGYKNSQSLVVMYDSVPNNSLPLLWHDDGHWLPLFPASGIL